MIIEALLFALVFALLLRWLLRVNEIVKRLRQLAASQGYADAIRELGKYERQKVE